LGQGLAALVIRRRHLHLPALAAEPGRHLFAIRDGNAGRGLPRPKRIRDKGKPLVQQCGDAPVAPLQKMHVTLATHSASLLKAQPQHPANEIEVRPLIFRTELPPRSALQQVHQWGTFRHVRVWKPHQVADDRADIHESARNLSRCPWTHARPSESGPGLVLDGPACHRVVLAGDLFEPQ